ncbi:MAG: hypothetical protein ACTSX0_09460 [Promethearchaeota archaeon]
MLLQTENNYDYAGLLNSGLTLLFTFIGLVIMIRCWVFIQQELKTSPVYTKWQKRRNTIGAMTFSVMVSFAVVFVLAMITSIFARNALLILPDVENTIWTEEMVKAFQFPNFLPITLFVIATFSFFYPIYEYYLLSKPSQEGATEIQQALETKFIDRFETPWNSLAAMFLFFLIVLAAPLVTSYIALNYWNIPSNLTEGWAVGIIFLVWLLLGPMFYLSYYTYNGTAHAIYRAQRVILKKEPQMLIIYIIAILSIISTVYSLISFSLDYLPIFWGNIPESVSNPSVTRSGAVEEIITFLAQINPNISAEEIEQIQMFFILFPLDFLGFILTTCLFGLFGFYKKFLSKEPLNTSKMVLFAAYIITGIAFSIFINAMYKYPDFFPDDNLHFIGLNLDFSRTTDRELIYRSFGFAILIQKILNIYFLVHFLFLDKSIPQNADEWVLNRAIISNDFETLKKYSRHENFEMRILVADTVIKYVHMKDSLPRQTAKHISEIIGELLSDENPKITRILKGEINEIIIKLDKKTLITTLTELLESKEKSKIKQARNVLRQIVKRNILNPLDLCGELIKKNLSNQGYETVFHIVALYEKQEHKAVWKFIHPLLSSNSKPQVIFGALKVIANVPSKFAPQSKDLEDIFLSLVKHKNTQMLIATLQTFGNYAMAVPALISTLMGTFNEIPDKDDEIVRQKLGIVVKLTNIKPEWFENFFAYIEKYLKSSHLQYKADAAVALGSLSSQISEDLFKKYLYPYFKLFVNSSSLDIRQATLSSLIVIAQTRKDIYSQNYFQHLFSPLLIDDIKELRHLVHRFFIESDSPHYLLGDIAILLKTPLTTIVRIDLLNILTQITDKITPYLDEISLIPILISQAEQIEETLKYEQIVELRDEKTTFFGFRENFESLTVFGTTLALLAEILYHAPAKYDELFVYLESHYAEGGEVALAKILDVYFRILQEKLRKLRKGYPDINIDNIMFKLKENYAKLTPNIQNILVRHMIILFNIDKGFFGEIFEILHNLLSLHLSLSVNTIKQTLILFATLIGEQTRKGFKTQKILNYSTKQFEKVNPYEETFKPLIYRYMHSKEPLVQEGIAEALKRLIETTNKEKIIQSLILDTIQTSKDSRTKITAMNVLMNLPIEGDFRKELHIVEHQISSSDEYVKAKALEVLGYFLRKFPPVSRRENKRSYKHIKSLIYSHFVNLYNPNLPPVVKKAIVEEISSLALIQVNLPLCLKLIVQAVRDPEPTVAVKALNTYFAYADKFEIRKIRFQQDIRSFANTNVVEVHKKLVQKLLEYHQKGIRMQIVIPTLLKLASSDNSEIRSTTHGVFMAIFKSDPNEFMDYFDIIFKLISDRNPAVRKDAGKMILQVLFTNPEPFAENNQVFYSFQRLAFDSNEDVRIMLSSNLAELERNFPDRTNDVLNMCYNIIRFNDEMAIHPITLVLKTIWNKNPAFQEDIFSKLTRFYKKTQNAELFSLLAELDPKKSSLLKKRMEKFKSRTEKKEWKRLQKQELIEKKKQLKARRVKKYKELYRESPPFDLEGFEYFGRMHRISEGILAVLFIVFFAIGIWSLYVIGVDVTVKYAGVNLDQLEGMSKILGKYSLTSILVIVGIYIVSLLAAYFIVRVFAEIAMVIMYLVLFVQVALYYILYRYVEFEYNGQNYNWVFLVLIIPSILFLTIWRRKFKLASKFLKMSCLVVVKEKQMLIPQFFQTFLVNLLSFFYGLTAWKFFFKIEKNGPTVIYQKVSELGINDTYLFIGFTALFVFLIYIVFYSTLGMKQLMIHHWYRGGSLSYRKSFRVLRRRWWGLMGYAFTSTIIHMIQFVTKFLKGDYHPKTPKEAMELAAKVKPVDPQSFDKTKKVKGKKKKAPLIERLWMYMNMFTMPAIVIENRPYSLALLRSIRMIVTNTVDLFIKQSNVNKVFRVMQYIMWATNALIGGFVGALFGWIYGVNMIITVGIAVPLFLWVGGMTQTLIINDLNTSYLTIMYVYTLDIIYNKYGYTRYKLEKPKEIERWEKKQEKKAKRRSKREERKERRIERKREREAAKKNNPHPK